MTCQEFDGFRTRLLQARSALIARIREGSQLIREQAHDVGGLDVVDLATSSHTKSLNLSTCQMNRRFLRQIEEALSRMERKTYGRCQECGKPIGKRRLVAIPWAHLCVGCQQQEEQESRLN